MGADDEVVEAVAQAIRQADYECEMAESVQMPVASWTHHQAAAVLAVPVIADAMARDAKVARIVAAGRFPGGVSIHATEALRIAALYPEVKS